ncbi:unnamed protein product (macronuclear) [Paramecium tetraurelia]|uniref:RING-type domain-containing protein n=1 Tax=Paramecium tetraurelia TaxID=5888 RepID=A0EHW6_PARTE|nr:uncharacterized protein GSPATT00027234001 [Paramecium tetraurelia]CAK94907.1 unnamed protein product [Paramecium tetraurelia]|eukprot:XP_001462280.1 hypothetical protein (macronuclear) [Paramecium tetraurelia strain d4-2]
MDCPIKVSQLKSVTEQKEVFDKLFKMPTQHVQRSQYKQISKSDLINELRQENDELKNTIIELKDRIQELELQLKGKQSLQIEEENQEIISVEKPQQEFQEEMNEEEKSLHIALILQQQEEMEFQNRLIQMQNNVDLDEMSYEQLQELQEKMGFVSRGLMENQISILLKQCTIRNQAVDCCTICLEESGNPVEIQLECSHVFHKECISEWLSREKHCPVCKRDIDLGKLK